MTKQELKLMLRIAESLVVLVDACWTELSVQKYDVLILNLGGVMNECKELLKEGEDDD